MALETIKVLDGYVKYVGHMGNDETFVEAARMSTGKGFLGWYWEEDTYSNCYCGNCETHHLIETLPTLETTGPVCTACWGEGCIIPPEEDDEYEHKLLGRKGQKRDLSLLEYLYSNRHSTPFEMGELAIEVEAPLFVFREWHRHRTQSYNEFSARYSMMPNKHYIPELSRFQRQSKSNKQGSATAIPESEAKVYQALLTGEQHNVYLTYENMLEAGLAKELARINTPVSRYSKMRAKTDIRNWLAFLALRMEMSAQWEIRQYANAVASLIKQLFPKTFELFLEWDLLGVRFSRTEMSFLHYLFNKVLGDEESRNMVSERAFTFGMEPKQLNTLLLKLTTNKGDLYKEVLDKL